MLKMQTRLLIDGELRDAVDGRRGTSFDPGSGRPVGSYAIAGSHEVNAAIAAARRAFDAGPWPRMAPADRAERLMELADRVLAEAGRIAAVEALDSGGLIGRTLADVRQGTRFMRRMARLTTTDFPWRENLPPGSPLWPSRNYVVREPVGVCAAIVPWNFPLLTAIWKITMAAVTGNAVVLSAAPDTPLAALLLGELIASSRVPRGVVNILASADHEVAKALVRHPAVDRVSFTGSTRVGSEVLTQAAPTIKRVSLELGGKSANIVLDDADLDLAVDGAVFAAFLHAGQVCESGTRLLVPRRLLDGFLEALLPRVRAIRVGYQLDAATQMGPVLNERRRAAVEADIARGREEGAVLLTGGDRVAVDGYDGGFYLAPAIFTNVAPGSRLDQEEVLGPVLSVLPYDDEDEVIGRANATAYGLAAAIWSTDIARAERLATHLRAGTIWINDYHAFSDYGPFGGFKQSGFGHELGRHGLESFTELKHVHVGTEADPDAKVGHRVLHARSRPAGYEHTAPTRVISGPGAVARLASELRPDYRVLLVTDTGVAAAGGVDRVRRALGAAVVTVFDAVPPDSGLAVVDAAADAGRRAGANAVLSLGGGSVIDTGKAVALALRLDARALDLLGVYAPGSARVFHAAVPTTAGTGSEVTNVAVIRNEHLSVKAYIVDASVIPDLAILDAELTVTLPAPLTASTAADALTHAIEAYTSTKANPMADAHALHAIRLIHANLGRAIADGRDLRSRAAMLSAATLAGQAVGSASVGLVHAMSHAIGARHRVPHGLANAILLPHVVRWNGQRPDIAARYGDVAAALGLDVDPAEPGLVAESLARALTSRFASVGLPVDLSTVGVPRTAAAACAALATLDLAAITNGRPAKSLEIQAIYEAAAAGVTLEGGPP